MKNFIQDGNVVTLPAPPVTGSVSGGVLAVGSLIGVAATTEKPGDPVEVALVGVFDLPKGAGEIAQGSPVFWDGSVVTEDDGDTPLGIAIETAATDASVVRVRLGAPVMAVVAAGG